MIRGERECRATNRKETETRGENNECSKILLENEFLLLNTNCSNRIFMDFVRKQCKLDSKGIYDLIDETGVTADLYTKEANENIASLFTPRTMYILAAIELHEDNSIKKITPCLSEWEKKFPFLERKLKHRDKKQIKLGSDICSPDSPTSPKENSKLNRKRSERTSGTSRSDNQKENLSPTSGEHGGGSAKKLMEEIASCPRDNILKKKLHLFQMK